MCLVATRLLLALIASAVYGQPTFQPAIPKTWDNAALVEWATQVAGVNLRPKHISTSEYYAFRLRTFETYPVSGGGL